MAIHNIPCWKKGAIRAAHLYYTLYRELSPPIPRAFEQADGHGVTVLGYSVIVLYIDRYGNQTKKDKDSPSFLQCSPSNALNNLSYTRMSAESTNRPALDLFNLGYPHFPHSWGVFQLWHNQSIVCRFKDLWHLCLNVPPDKAEHPVCTAYCSVSVGIPGETTGDINFVRS